ncbi:MAG: endo-1,4-beta-xylanase [Bacteroidales bacterium]
MNYIIMAMVSLAMVSCEKTTPPTLKEPIVANDTIKNDTTNMVDNDPEWLKSAKERIEIHRKSDIKITVSDISGEPVPDAEVAVKMSKHAFGFGALMGQSRWEDKPNPEDARLCRELVEKYFNKLVVGAHNNEVGDIQLDWLKERGIEVRGHYLMWARIQIEDEDRRGQPDVMPADTNELKEIAFQYIEEMVTWAGNRISEWDAINHIVTDISDHLGYDHLFGPSFFADVIKHAREHAPPGVEFWVNEGSILPGDGSRQDKYIAQIRKLLEYGGTPDGIGFMSHFKQESDLISMDKIYERLDRFAELVPNLQLTEFDINVADQQLQAEYLHDVMTIAYSHPAVSGIVMWQIWGGGANNTTLWNSDWTIKPAGEAWLDLVFNQWWTDLAGETDANGKYNLRGFLGDYDITVTAMGQTKTIKSQLDTAGISLDFVF